LFPNFGEEVAGSARGFWFLAETAAATSTCHQAGGATFKTPAGRLASVTLQDDVQVGNRAAYEASLRRQDTAA
jgi:hypothetical protein